MFRDNHARELPATAEGIIGNGQNKLGKVADGVGCAGIEWGERDISRGRTMMADAEFPRVFDTDRRIRLGIWGLGRGMSFYNTCRALNIDVVAGCDYNAHMRENFLRQNPDAFVSADADDFLAQDFDAVLLATFCPAHAGDALKCLAAGKHVLSEVTAFHTVAEGVQLVEAVEKSGLVYNLAENYPFSAANMYLARKWKEGLFGELMYAEFEYVHECRTLAYTYIDGVPVQPGWAVHNWRSWIDFHYYCTHSLGPIMVITGERPTRVVTLPGKQKLAGYLSASQEGMGGIAPSLISMSNGSVVRNLMGATTNDTHVQRLWGTLGSAEINVGAGLALRLGASGGSPKMAVNPRWDDLGELAAKTGHGGGDFWVLYYFARQIFTGEPGPFDIYGAADVTLPGILAVRSAQRNGEPQHVPDFRDPAERERYRHDDWAQPHFDTMHHVFPTDADESLTRHFSTTISALIFFSLRYRAYTDWMKVADELVDPQPLYKLLNDLIDVYPGLRENYAMARKLIDAYPASEAARVLREMLVDIGEEERALAPGFIEELIARRDAMQRMMPELPVRLTQFTVSALRPGVGDIGAVRHPRGAASFTPLAYQSEQDYVDVRGVHHGQDGLIFLQGTITLARGGCGTLLYGADGPVKVWVNGVAAGCESTATNPIRAREYSCPAKWRDGVNTVTFALGTNHGHAWGVNAQAVVEQ